METEPPRKAKVPDQLDMELAADADLNEVWFKIGSEFLTPRERITVGEALLAQSELMTGKDIGPLSEN
jgi:hypothetical protein